VITASYKDNIRPGKRELRTKISASAARPEDCDPHLRTFR
jgi:hypothetical protein